MPTLILINPAAGRSVDPEKLQKLIAGRFKREDEEFEIRVTPSPVDWENDVRTAQDWGFDKLLAAGGDGSIHLTLQAMDFEKLSLGILPFGSGNDIYRAFAIPTGIEYALDNFFSGEERIDVGEANGRYFLNTAGCGLDTWTIQVKNQSAGKSSCNYLFLFLKIILAIKPLDLEVDVDGVHHKTRGFWALAANNRYIGGGMKVAPDADMRDSLLDVLIIGDISKAEMIFLIPRIFKGTHINHPKINIVRGRNIIIDSKQEMPCALDGDLHSTTPLEIKLHPGKLRLRGRIKAT